MALYLHRGRNLGDKSCSPSSFQEHKHVTEAVRAREEGEDEDVTGAMVSAVFVMVVFIRVLF